MKTHQAVFLFATLYAVSAISEARAQDQAPALNALAKMPVREVTVFKDGSAFVLHQGKMPVAADGSVLMDYLPSPVLGTFWPFVAENDVKLTSVNAGQRRVTVERTALDIQGLIEANPGAQVEITETPASNTQPPPHYPGTIIGLTERGSAELEATSGPNSGEMLPQKGSVVLVRTADGVKAVRLERIMDVTFKDPPKSTGGNIEFRNLLTLHLDWGKRKPEAAVEAGLMYLQHGIRWIPEYKITIDGEGKATVKLQATLVNDLTDMEDVTCNLVVGVPNFKFKDEIDPMALQQSMAQVSQYMTLSNGSQTSQVLSNAIMTQAAAPAEKMRQAESGGEAVAPGMDTVEDLHVFTVSHVTLKKGERMVLPVSEITVPYHDVYVLELPFAPPVEIWQRFNNNQQSELARLLSAPKVMHKIRLSNSGDSPFTTAPALIANDKQVLAQAMMTYTPKGGTVDLDVTTAVDVLVKKTDIETKRSPNAVDWDGSSYTRVDLAGTITLTNYRKQPVELEVVRNVLGSVTEAGQDGKFEAVNVLEDSSYMADSSSNQPSWWGWWNWPNWWSHFNGVNRITWKQKVEPGKSVDLKYAWHYFWR